MTKKTEKNYEITRDQVNEIMELRKSINNCNAFASGISEKEYRVKRKIREILGA